MKNKRVKTLSGIVGMLIIIQMFLYCIKQVVFLLVKRTDFSDHMASMIAMLVLLILLIMFAIQQKVSLSVFPQHFGKTYSIATCVAILLFVVTPSNYSGGFQAILLLIYGSLVTPIFEELLFRGYVWNKLNSVWENEWITYSVSTILFALWHIGYIDSIAFRAETGLANAIFWKVITGLCYGIILGAVRFKSKNCYSTILLHGIMNIFGR